MNMMFGLYCETPSVLLSNILLPNVHIMTTIEVLSLSLLELFGKCKRRVHIMKLSIMTELDLSFNRQKLGVRNIVLYQRKSCSFVDTQLSMKMLCRHAGTNSV